MRPYLDQTVRIEKTWIDLDGTTYNPEHIEQMESIAHLWCDRNINVYIQGGIQLILNSPTILQCQKLYMDNAHFSFKDYKILYNAKVIENYYRGEETDPNYWPQFLEEPGAKLQIAFLGDFNIPLTSFHSRRPMSLSKPKPQFNFDVLYYLNRDQLERFSIVCRPLKNFIERYFHSKPYRYLGRLEIRGGLYALFNQWAQWHPNRDDYTAQQFLADQVCSIDESKGGWDDRVYYSFAEMRPYLGPTVRVDWTYIYVAGKFTYNFEHIADMESIAYLWRDHQIDIGNSERSVKIGAVDFLLILNSPTILQCQYLFMNRAHFPFKYYKVLYTMKEIDMTYDEEDSDIDPSYWPEFLEQPGVKPIVNLNHLNHGNFVEMLNLLSKAFSSAIEPNAYKIVFSPLSNKHSFIEFREMNKTSGEKLELKKKCSVYNLYDGRSHENVRYTLERSSI
ncbi:hypothetical protein Ddc_21274 [Ditylenchus destructor]|nr:hypothetical protein Ddc_21274 [Ditylenchus destructor]